MSQIRSPAIASLSERDDKEGSLNHCWVLIVTRGLRVWLPPEVYVHDRETAVREGRRWCRMLRIPLEPGAYRPRAKALHSIQTVFLDPWRACPVWLGLTWSVRSYPAMKTELMAADEQEATDWLRRRVPKSVGLDGAGQVEFERRGVLSSAGVFRIKRVTGH